MWPAYVVGSVYKSWLDALELDWENALVSVTDGTGVVSLAG
mgnify:CR=1